MKKQAQTPNSATILNSDSNGHQSNLNMSREVSIIDLQLPVKQTNSTSSKKRKPNLSYSLENNLNVTNENELQTTQNSLASKIINSGNIKLQASLFPSPITANSENAGANTPETETGNYATDHTTDYQTAYQNRNKNYLSFVLNQQKKRHSGEHGTTLNKRSIKFFNQDISIGSGLNNISTGSLLIRRLKF